MFLTKTKEQKEQDRREQMAGLKAQFLKPQTVKGGSAARSRRAPIAANGQELSAPAQTSASQSTPQAKATFVDRAAARRQRDIGAAIPLPPQRKQPTSSVSASAAASPFFVVPGATASATAAAASSVAPLKPADPFASDSRGAQLLSKLAGGVSSPGTGKNGPGSITGAGSNQLGTLIEARTARGGPGERRAGLGSQELVVGVENVAASYQGGAGANGERRDWRDAGRERSWKRFREV